MTKLFAFIFIFSVAINFAISAPQPGTGYNFDYLAKILKNMSEKDRLLFLQHHMRLGRTLSEDEDELIDTKPDLPEEFSLFLYNYGRESFKITDEQMLKQLREVVCFEDGVCIDLGDIGVHP